MKLTSDNVHTIFMNCLFKDNKLNTNVDERVYIEARGVVNHIGFHPGRIKESSENIFDMLKELPKEFLQTGGGGYTFLNACNDKDGEQWTGSQKVMDELVCLGLAIEKVSYCLPRELWSALPGGVPYFMVKDVE